MEQTECSETSAYKIQTPGNYPEENIQNTEHGESLKSRMSAASYICLSVCPFPWNIFVATLRTFAKFCVGDFR